MHHSSYVYNYYTVKSDGISIGSGHRFSRHISGYLGYGYSRNAYDLKPGFQYNGSSFFFQSYAKSSVTMSTKFDNTDDFYLPRKGFSLSQSFQKSGLGAEANFFKSRTNFGAYKGLQELLNFDAIVRYKARYNFAADTGYLPVAERFYMGGLGSIRGYQSYSLSPSITQSNGTKRRVGAKQTFSNSVELSMPLVPKARMRIVTYLDWGFIGNDVLTEISRGGYGAGIEWFSPVGPIQLMFAKALNAQPGDRTQHFAFTMGQRF